MSPAAPQVALVTGASRGAGKGIALALGAAGMTVYVTGRTQKPGKSPWSGTIHDTATAITAAGGQGVAVHVDHRNDDEVEALFARVREEEGRLDLLVNNAALIHDELQSPLPFWEKPLAASVDLLEVGLRSGLVASYYAAPLLVETGRGLVAFTSAPGAVHYQYGAAYGAHKAGMDKFAADMAVDLSAHRVAAVSLWLGPQLTERTAAAGRSRPEQYAAFLRQGETPQFNGRIIHGLACDPELMSLSGQTLISAEIAHRYGITEASGREPPSYRDMLGAPRVPHPAKVM